MRMDVVLCSLIQDYTSQLKKITMFSVGSCASKYFHALTAAKERK